MPSLPSYAEASAPLFKWGTLNGKVAVKTISDCYDEATSWRRNIFKIPSGKSGNLFVKELTRLFNAFGEGTALESIALKAAMLLPILVLQKPNKTSKAKDHIKLLERRLTQWSNGEFMDLMDECRSIQHRCKWVKSSSSTKEQLARSFSNLMMMGRVKSALRLLSNADTDVKPLSPNSTLPSGESVYDTLKLKHPPGQHATPLATDLSYTTSINPPHPVIFDEIDGVLIRKLPSNVKEQQVSVAWTHSAGVACVSLSRPTPTTYVPLWRQPQDASPPHSLTQSAYQLSCPVALLHWINVLG